MARETVVWCEVHYRMPGVERVPARTHEGSVDRSARGVDLCDECFDKHLKPYADFLNTFGFAANGPTKPGRKKAAPAARQSEHPPVTDEDKNAEGKYVCRFDSCDRTFGTPSALGVHLARFQHEPTKSNASRPSGAPKKSTSRATSKRAASKK